MSYESIMYTGMLMMCILILTYGVVQWCDYIFDNSMITPTEHVGQIDAVDRVGKIIWFSVPNGQIISDTVVKEEDSKLYTEKGHIVHIMDYFDSFQDALEYKQLTLHNDDWSNPL